MAAHVLVYASRWAVVSVAEDPLPRCHFWSHLFLSNFLWCPWPWPGESCTARMFQATSQATSYITSYVPRHTLNVTSQSITHNYSQLITHKLHATLQLHHWCLHRPITLCCILACFGSLPHSCLCLLSVHTDCLGCR